jgi:hypothetical protein
MPDLAEVDDALVAKLLGDATLMALVPDGVFFDTANDKAERFVTISFVHGSRQPVFDGDGIEAMLYSVKAVVLSTKWGTVARAAAQRIDEILDDGDLDVPGFGVLAMFRDDDDGRIRYTEIEERDKTSRWQHRGARYRVQVTPIPITMRTQGDTPGNTQEHRS